MDLDIYFSKQILVVLKNQQHQDNLHYISHLKINKSMNSKKITSLLKKVKTIAIVGASTNPQRDSYKVMNVYLMLFAAIGMEVIGTMLLPASQNFTKIAPTSILLLSYGGSFYFLAIVSQKLPLSVVYASWSGIGIFSIAILSYIFYKQSLNWQTVFGLFLIVIGVTIVNLYKS